MILKIVFGTDTGGTHIQTLNDIREDITSTEVDDYCNSTILLDVIVPKDGNKVISVISRETILTTTTNI